MEYQITRYMLGREHSIKIERNDFEAIRERRALVQVSESDGSDTSIEVDA